MITKIVLLCFLICFKLAITDVGTISSFIKLVRSGKHTSQQDYCFVSTIHQGIIEMSLNSLLFIAKGMEWDYVIVARFNDGTMPIIPVESGTEDDATV